VTVLVLGTGVPVSVVPGAGVPVSVAPGAGAGACVSVTVDGPWVIAVVSPLCVRCGGPLAVLGAGVSLAGVVAGGVLVMVEVAGDGLVVSSTTAQMMAATTRTATPPATSRAGALWCHGWRGGSGGGDGGSACRVYLAACVGSE
jgi:hypothetical protein